MIVVDRISSTNRMNRMKSLNRINRMARRNQGNRHWNSEDTRLRCKARAI